MNILALDTASTTCNLGIQVGRILHVRSVLNARQHSASILQAIEDLQIEAGITIYQLDRIVWNAGPGSFTGLRISASVCQALSYSLQIPVLPVSSLEALACSVLSGLPVSIEDVCIAVAIDARMGSFYWANFVFKQGNLVRLTEDRLVEAADLASLRQGCLNDGRKWILSGDGWALVENTVIADEYFYVPDVSAGLEAIMALARQAAESDWSTEAQQCVPRYLHQATHWKKRQLKASSKS
ncbi:MAG TPA: tRNA (adenosine(37)-N6)-threonylcarbamoyltransferase complex dimerization subunit type 1 TsaB [Pseudomonadales bacterium]|nr:tRNA (adenosine(37)-N6)-threonylcarbamoyltransferase complex dimerization subunit type 1 TsaB [Pseudomonadales bacterium]